MQDLLELIARRHVNLRNTGGPWPQAEVRQRELQMRVQAIEALQRLIISAEARGEAQKRGQQMHAAQSGKAILATSITT